MEVCHGPLGLAKTVYRMAYIVSRIACKEFGVFNDLDIHNTHDAIRNKSRRFSVKNGDFYCIKEDYG